MRLTYCDFALEYIFFNERSCDVVIAYICSITGYYVIEYSSTIYRFSDRQNATKMLENCTFIGVL